jgi:hypothetical protein
MAFILRLLGIGKASPPPAAPPPSAAAPAPARTREAAVATLCTEIINATAKPDEKKLRALENHWKDLKATITPALRDEIYQAALKINELYKDRVPPYFNKLIAEVFQKKLDQIERDAYSPRANLVDLTNKLKNLWIDIQKTKIGEIGSQASHNIETVAVKIRLHYDKLTTKSQATTDDLIKLQRANFEAIVARLQTPPVSITKEEHEQFTKCLGNYWASIGYQAPYKNLAARLLFAVETLQNAKSAPKLDPIKAWITPKLLPADRLPIRPIILIETTGATGPATSPSTKEPKPSSKKPPTDLDPEIVSPEESPKPGASSLPKRVEVGAGVPAAASHTAPKPTDLGRPPPIRIPDDSGPLAAPSSEPRLSQDHVQRMSSDLATKALLIAEDIPSTLGAHELASHLSTLATLFNHEDCYFLAGSNSLDTVCRNYMTCFFKLSEEDQQAILSLKYRELHFILNYAMRTVLEDADTLMKAVIGKAGKLTDEEEKQYKEYLSYFNFLKGLERTTTEENAGIALRTFLRTVYSLNLQYCEAIRSKKPSDYGVSDETLAGRLGCDQDSADFTRLKNTNFRDTDPSIIKKFESSYRILGKIELSSRTPADCIANYLLRKARGDRRLSGEISSFKADAAREKEAAIREIEIEQARVFQPIERCVNSFLVRVSIPDPKIGNLTTIRETKSILKALLSQVKNRKQQADIESLVTELERVETTIIVKNAPIGAPITGTSQFSQPCIDLKGDFGSVGASHACAFIAAANIKAQLSGRPISHEDAILEGLHHQQVAIHNRLLKNQSGYIEITPSEARPLRRFDSREDLYTDDSGNTYQVVGPYPGLTEMDSAKRVIKDELTPIQITEDSGLAASERTGEGARLRSTLPLEEGKETATYGQLLIIMSEAAEQYGKIGAVVRLGSAFLSITMQKTEDGKISVTLTDSHGFHENSGADELEGRAFTCNFGKIEGDHAILRAADFLSVYYRAHGSKEIEFHLFTTKPPRDASGVGRGAGSARTRYTFNTEVIEGHPYIIAAEQSAFMDENKALFLRTASRIDLLRALYDAVKNGQAPVSYLEALEDKHITFDPNPPSLEIIDAKIQGIMAERLEENPSRTSDRKVLLREIIEVCDWLEVVDAARAITIMEKYWAPFTDAKTILNDFLDKRKRPPTINIPGIKAHAKMLLARELRRKA